MACRGALDALPVVDGELQWHAVGCYSTHADLKLANVLADPASIAAEAFTEIPPPPAPPRRPSGSPPAAWEGVLFAQFHDALGGTCTDRAT